MLITPFRPEEIEKYVFKTKAGWQHPLSSNLLKHDRIRKLDLCSLNDLSDLKFHYSLMRNGRSIEASGLKSSIGRNSKNLDEQEAIYFSWGAEAVLHNWDVWLKWKMSQFYNPIAAQRVIKRPVENIARYTTNWYNYVTKRGYTDNMDLLEPVFDYEKAELSSSYYFSIDLEKGIDFDPDQLDPKKELIQYSEYACEIYGAGFSTNVHTQKAEKWNMSTPLGKSVTIPPERLCHLTVRNGETALDVLCYLYEYYMEYCDEKGTPRPKFVLLDKFMSFCE